MPSISMMVFEIFNCIYMTPNHSIMSHAPYSNTSIPISLLDSDRATTRLPYLLDKTMVVKSISSRASLFLPDVQSLAFQSIFSERFRCGTAMAGYLAYSSSNVDVGTVRALPSRTACWHPSHQPSSRSSSRQDARL